MSLFKKALDRLISEQKVTPGIINHIVSMAQERQGVMIFTSTIRHAKEVVKVLPAKESCLVVGETKSSERDAIVQKFKDRKIKFLVNVSVLTTEL